MRSDFLYFIIGSEKSRLSNCLNIVLYEDMLKMSAVSSNTCLLFLNDTTALSRPYQWIAVSDCPISSARRFSSGQRFLFLVGVSHIQLASSPTHNTQTGSSRASLVANNKIKEIRPQCLYFTPREFSIFDLCVQMSLTLKPFKQFKSNLAVLWRVLFPKNSENLLTSLDALRH